MSEIPPMSHRCPSDRHACSKQSRYRSSWASPIVAADAEPLAAAEHAQLWPAIACCSHTAAGTAEAVDLGGRDVGLGILVA
jgi:hypothetical protein